MPRTDDRVDALYTVPLDDFVRERDALARALKEEGATDAAREVKTLRKPSVAAWGVNQLAHADGLDDLLDAADDLRSAQRRALTGSGGDVLRDAARSFRTALKEAMAAVEELLGPSATAAQLDKVSATLQATATDESASDMVRAGRLARALDPTGFGDLATLTVIPGDGSAGEDGKPGKAGKAGKRSKGDRQRTGGRAGEGDADSADERRRERIAELEVEAERAESDAKLLEADAERLAAAAEELAEQVKQLDAERDVVEDERRQASSEAAEARRAAKGARRDADRVQKQLKKAKGDD